MMRHLTATRFIKRMTKGRTEPLLLAGDDEQDNEHNVIVKLLSKEYTVMSMICEAISAMVASGLGIQVPEPFLVSIDSDFANELPADIRGRFVRDVGMCRFGSCHMTDVDEWSPSHHIAEGDYDRAAEIFAFDAITQNSDRKRGRNSNLLVRGTQIFPYDHELALRMDIPVLGGWPKPWDNGALQFLTGTTQHAFYGELRNKTFSLDRFGVALAKIDADQLQLYKKALPDEWLSADSKYERHVNNILEYIDEVRQNWPRVQSSIKGIL